MRFRHEDTDIVRAARQQDFLRQAKQQITASTLIDNNDRLMTIFGRNTSTDSALRSRTEVLRLLKLALFSATQPIQEVSFRGTLGPSYVETHRRPDAQDDARVPQRRGHARAARRGDQEGQAAQAQAEAARGRRPRGRHRLRQGPGACRPSRPGAGETLPALYPTLRLQGSVYAGPPRVYKLRGTDGKRYGAYRMVLQSGHVGEYYGLQGITWKNPPILEGVTETRKIGRRTYELAYDGDRLRLVAWRTPKAVYWISNTLLLSLDEKQMLAIARSVRRSVACSAAWTTDRNRSASSAWAGSASSRPPASPSSATRSGRATSCPRRSSRSTRGEVPIHEPGLPELVAKNAERLHFTTDMAEVLEHARLLFVCVDTPPTYSGDADLSRVESVLDELGDSSEHALVMKSTVPVGTGRSIQRRRPGTGLRLQPRVPQGGQRGRGLHEARPRRGRRRRGARRSSPSACWPCTRRSSAPVVSTDVASAEMIKLASNAFLATKISFINEIANVSEELGADVLEVARGMGLDDRIGPKFLQAGIGYGGSCFPKDVQALKQLAGNTGYHFQLLTSVIEVNELQKRRTIGKLQKHLGLARGQGGRPARAWPSSRTPTTSARRPAWCCRAGSRARAPTCASTTRLPPAPPTRCSAARASATRRSRRSTAPTPWCS